jgi:hypothetical protein
MCGTLPDPKARLRPSTISPVWNISTGKWIVVE